ncbi:UNVERIFIED_ORG: integrase-like protein [Burkholderia sp. CF145]|nr:Integrase [Burkholderia sp. CF099]
MAMLADAVHDVAAASARLKGSVGHQERRRRVFANFLRFVRDAGALTRSIPEIPPSMVHAYAAHCVVQGMAPGHLENIFSAIRVVFRAMGKDIGRTCSNRQLGLPHRSRKGTRRAQSPGEIEALIERAKRIDQGLALLIPLARNLGLRRKEALMCGKDLQMWYDALTSGKTVLEVLRGCKGGRHRQVEILEDRRAQTIEVIAAALAYARAHNYELITGRAGTLKSAMNRFTALLRKAGMVGEKSFHSLRYGFALQLALQILDRGVSPYDTLVRLSASLGHGPSRVAMVCNVYCQPIAHLFKGCLAAAKRQRRSPGPATKLPRAAARLAAKLRHARLSGFPVGRMD